ncbi:Plus3 domain-containing protein [Abeliophyllum distichum]|uniref:Plus3 domain-containing protein n=1 Tax=Abeliophyllum distichum TaxID=126358 RepID=A0ABD1U1K5_9LAMI
MVEGINEDVVLSSAPLTTVPPLDRSSQQAEMSGDREAGSEKQLWEWHRTYRIPDDIEFFVLGPNDRANDLPLECVTLNQAMLATGLRLPFPRIVRKFLCEWRIAPTQLCPNGWRVLIGFLILWDQLGFSRPSAREFNSLYYFKSDGKKSGWWYASVKAKTGGSVVTQTPDSIKNWKKFWFFVRDPWQFSSTDTRPDVNIPVRYHELSKRISMSIEISSTDHFTDLFCSFFLPGYTS